MSLSESVVTRLCERRDLATLTFMESRWREDAMNVNSIEASYGLGQINVRAHPEYSTKSLLDAEFNIMVTEFIYDSRQGDPGLKYGYYNGGGPSNKRIPVFNEIYSYINSLSDEDLRARIASPALAESIIKEASLMSTRTDKSGVKLTSVTKEEAKAIQNESRIGSQETQVNNRTDSDQTDSESKKKGFFSNLLEFFSNPGRSAGEALVRLNDKVINSSWAPEFVKVIMKKLNSGINASLKVGDGLLFALLLIIACIAIALRIRPVSKLALDLFEKLGGVAWAAKNKGGVIGTAVWILLTAFMKVIKALNRAVTFSFNDEKDSRNVWRDENFRQYAPNAARAMDWGIGSKLGSFRQPMQFVRSTR